MNRIRWFVDAAMDAPELRSPQPCPRGIACDYKRKNEAGVLEKAWCKYVHPGEEGTGRSIWAEKRLDDGTILPAVVRLSGQPMAAGGGWVQRLKERLPWADWAAKHGLQADTAAGPLEIVRIGGSRGQQQSPLPQGSQSHRRPQRIDLGPALISASALQAPSEFPSLPQTLRCPPLPPSLNLRASAPQPPPRLNLLSSYEHGVRLGFYGPVAFSERDGNAGDDGSATPCLLNYHFRGPAEAALANARNAEAEAAAASFARGEVDDGCATPCLINFRCRPHNADECCDHASATPSLPPSSHEGWGTPRLPTTGENCGEGEMENLD